MSGKTATRTNSEWIKSVSRTPEFYLCLILVVYSALILPTLGRQGIGWDEQTDIEIARSYISRSEGWFIGSGLDPSQTRLPMFVVAVVYALLKTDDLLTARLISFLIGVLTLIAVYIYCRYDRDQKTGLLACAILASSPFFLAFSRVAFTESDILVTCSLAWLLVCMSVLREKNSLGWAAITAIVLGLAISAKFTAVFIFPAILLHALSSSKQDPEATHLSKSDILVAATLLSTAFTCVLSGWAVAFFSQSIGYEGWFRISHYMLVLFCWISILAWVVRHRNRAAKPVAFAMFIIVLSLLTFLVLPPVHITNPKIIINLAGRFHGPLVGWDPVFLAEAAALHLGSVIFKSSPVIGLGLLVGVVATMFQWKKRTEVRFPLLLGLFYFLGLLLLPLAQTFYMMPLLPILAIFASDQWLALLSKRKAISFLIGILAAVLLIVDLYQCYPDYNLNGYQWLGSRYLVRRSTISYRSVVQTTSDGVQQVSEWLNENVRPGQKVVAYVRPWHIVRATSSNPPFSISKGEWESLRTNPDFVISHINAKIQRRGAYIYDTGDVFREPFDIALLQANYTKVYSVQRAFDIEVANVWQRNDLIGQ